MTSLEREDAIQKGCISSGSERLTRYDAPGYVQHQILVQDELRRLCVCQAQVFLYYFPVHCFASLPENDHQATLR
jgi:hypothetical protein